MPVSPAWPFILTNGYDADASQIMANFTYLFGLLESQGMAGIGPLTSVPGGMANGTPLGTPPTGYVGVRFYLRPGDTVTFTIASAQPSAPPANTYEIFGTSTPNWDEGLAGTELIYVTATAGSPQFRWF